MIRTMGDATHLNVGVLRNIADLQMVAGYDTGTPDVRWTDADWNLFPGIPHVHIDQAFGSTRSTEAHVMVFDVEKGAFRPDQAETLIDTNTTPRPTIYVNRSNIAATIASALKSKNWKGDIWLSYPGWYAGKSLPPIPLGCRYVAIQRSFAGRFDLSVVLDDSWPALLIPIPNWTEVIVRELPTLRQGAAGIAVRRVQALNNAITTAHIAVDGDFGPQTKIAVETIQRHAGLTIDGIVGPRTWAVLLGV